MKDQGINNYRKVTTPRTGKPREEIEIIKTKKLGGKVLQH